MVHYIHRKPITRHVKSTDITPTPLGCIHYTILHLARAAALPRLNLGATLAHVNHHPHCSRGDCVPEQVVSSFKCRFCLDELIHHSDFSLFFPFSIQSMVAFLKDPSGPPLWEENPEAKDVLHVETEKVSGGRGKQNKKSFWTTDLIFIFDDGHDYKNRAQQSSRCTRLESLDVEQRDIKATYDAFIIKAPSCCSSCGQPTQPSPRASETFLCSSQSRMTPVLKIHPQPDNLTARTYSIYSTKGPLI